MGVHSKLSTPSWPPRGLLAALHGYEATLSTSALCSVSFFEPSELKTSVCVSELGTNDLSASGWFHLSFFFSF